MPTKRTWRERQSVEFPSAYQAAELLTGEICYPVIQYTGYGDGIGKDLSAFIGDPMRSDWICLRSGSAAAGPPSCPTPSHGCSTAARPARARGRGGCLRTIRRSRMTKPRTSISRAPSSGWLASVHCLWWPISNRTTRCDHPVRSTDHQLELVMAAAALLDSSKRVTLMERMAANLRRPGLPKFCARDLAMPRRAPSFPHLLPN